MPSLSRVWLWASAALSPAASRCDGCLEDGTGGAQDGDVGHDETHHHPPRGRGEEHSSDHVDDVVLAEEDDAHEDQAGPAEQDPGAAWIDAAEREEAEERERRVQRGEGGGRIGVEQAVEGADGAWQRVLRVDQVGDPAQQVILGRVPGWRRRHEHEEDESDHAHPEQRGDEAQVLGAVLEPEHQPHQQRHHEMAEVDDGRGHRQHVQRGAAHCVLQHLAGIVAEEEPLLEVGEARHLGRDAVVVDDPAHRLPSQEDGDERHPVAEEAEEAAAQERHRDEDEQEVIG
jgi:hypothetical protein